MYKTNILKKAQINTPYNIFSCRLGIVSTLVRKPEKIRSNITKSRYKKILYHLLVLMLSARLERIQIIIPVITITNGDISQKTILN